MRVVSPLSFSYAPNKTACENHMNSASKVGTRSKVPILLDDDDDILDAQDLRELAANLVGW